MVLYCEEPYLICDIHYRTLTHCLQIHYPRLSLALDFKLLLCIELLVSSFQKAELFKK
jgi:hypothetical protein